VCGSGSPGVSVDSGPPLWLLPPLSVPRLKLLLGGGLATGSIGDSDALLLAEGLADDLTLAGEPPSPGFDSRISIHALPFLPRSVGCEANWQTWPHTGYHLRQEWRTCPSPLASASWQPCCPPTAATRTAAASWT
jgi:hypothetical protein